MSAKLPEAIASAAESKVGVREAGGNNKGKDLAPFFAADSYKPNATDDGYAWCAAFVCWTVKTAMESAGTKQTPGFRRPTTPSAWGMEAWSLAQDSTTSTRKPAGRDIKRGDIVVFTFSHVGIATGPPGADGRVPTVEGNTDEAGSREGGGVYRKRRALSQIRSRIRFTI